jgi:hypothetical protein
MDHIDAHLATAAIENDYPLAIKAALAIGKKTLNRYYDKTDHSEVFRIAMGTIFLFQITLHLSYLYLVLHPRHKLKYFKTANWPDAWIEKAKEIVQTKFELSYGSLDDTSWVSQKKVCLFIKSHCK